MSGIVKYETEHGEVELSPAIVRSYLVQGNGRVSDQEVQLFLQLCRYQRLNPFLREAYLIKYGTEQPATIVTGKEVFTKRAYRHPDFDGLEAGVTVLRPDGSLERREGALVLDDETLIAGWARVHLKSRKVPIFAEASLAEYLRRNRDGKPTKAWAEMPATMIRKVALVQALREAFPEELQGLYDAAEMPVQEKLPEEPVQPAQAPVIVSAAIVTEAAAQEPAPCEAEDEETVEAELVLERGKHAGKTVSEVIEQDHDYAVWYAANGPAGPVRDAFREALENAGIDADAETRRAKLAKAWAAAKRIGWDAEDMHALIAERYGRQSSKELTSAELDDLVQHIAGIEVELQMDADGAETLWPSEGGDA